MSEELKPCPFCRASLDIKWVKKHSDHIGRIGYKVNCYSCETLGPFAFTEEVAIKLWNTRATGNEVKS